MHRIILPVLAVALAVAGAGAQRKKSGAGSRTITGTVVDSQNKPVASALVYCKDLRARTTRVKSADKDGRFQLFWLEQGEDYEIHAENRQLASATQRIAGSDTRKEISVTLKLDQKLAR
jgi:hypothetical protein